MGKKGDKQYPPLLPLGIHVKTVDQVQVLCVDAFPNSKTRAPIMAGLRALVGKLESNNIDAELWIDGSFVSEKPDPEDVDIVLWIPPHVHQSVTPTQQALLHALSANQMRSTHHCHTYALPVYPANHALRPMYDKWHVDWVAQWSSDYDDNEKGFVSFTVQAPLVGLVNP